MKFILTTVLALSVSTAFAHAEECPTDGAVLLKKVEAAKTCYEATQLAETCAWGSSFDVGLTGAAAAVCAKDFKKITKADKKAMDYMSKRCDEKYAKAEGTLALSMHSFCTLNVYKFWSGIYLPVEN